MKKYRELRRISMNAVYSICNTYHFYTRGDCKAYDNLLRNIVNPKKQLTVKYALKIATDIKNHSNTDFTEIEIAEIIISKASVCIIEV